MAIAVKLQTATKWLAAVAVVSYFGNWQYQSYVANKEEKARREREVSALSQAAFESLHRLATTQAASIGWLKELTEREKVRDSPIMSAELQQLWITGSPLLFVGKVRDISRNEDGSYQVRLEQGVSFDDYFFASAEIFLDAHCGAEQTARLLKRVADEARLDSWVADTAVVALVTRVGRRQVQKSDYEVTEFTAGASCIDVLSLTHELPSNWVTLLP